MCCIFNLMQKKKPNVLSFSKRVKLIYQFTVICSKIKMCLILNLSLYGELSEKFILINLRNSALEQCTGSIYLLRGNHIQ